MSFHALCCPHCEAPSRTRSGKRVTASVRDLYMVCTNVLCGCTWKAQLAIVCILSPSSQPNPRVTLPYRPEPFVRGKPPAPANDDAPPIALEA